MERVNMQNCGDGIRRADNGSWGKGPVVKTVGGTINLKAGETGTMFSNLGLGAALTFVLPPAKPGMWFTFLRSGNGTVAVKTLAGVTLGAALAGKQMEAVTAGDFAALTVVAVSTTAWLVVGQSGTWAVNNT